MTLTERIAAVRQESRRAPCIASLGIQFLEFDEGYCKLVARHDTNYNGLLPGFHGGMLANVADCAAWFGIATVLGPYEPLVTADLFIRYLSACAGDATAVARIIKVGRTLCPVNVQLFDPNGKPVAYAVVTYARTTTGENAGRSDP